MAEGKRANIKLVCFDLDNTITNFDLYERLLSMGPGRSSLRRKNVTDAHMDRAFANRDHGGIRNQPQLLQTMRDIMAAGIGIAITSHNIYWQQFPYVLQRVGLTNEEIGKIHLSQCEPNKSDWPAKEALIRKAKGFCRRKHHVALVDDNREIVEFAERAGYNAIQTNLAEGDIRYLNELRELVGLSPLATPERPAADDSLTPVPAEPPPALDALNPHGKRTRLPPEPKGVRRL